MRHIRDVMRRTRASLVRLVGTLQQKIRTLEASSVSQSQRLSDLESRAGQSIHTIELEEEHRVADENQRRQTMSNSALRLDLAKQYGATRWAKKLIDSITLGRAE